MVVVRPIVASLLAIIVLFPAHAGPTADSVDPFADVVDAIDLALQQAHGHASWAHGLANTPIPNVDPIPELADALGRENAVAVTALYGAVLQGMPKEYVAGLASAVAAQLQGAVANGFTLPSGEIQCQVEDQQIPIVYDSEMIPPLVYDRSPNTFDLVALLYEQYKLGFNGGQFGSNGGFCMGDDDGGTRSGPETSFGNKGIFIGGIGNDDYSAGQFSFGAQGGLFIDLGGDDKYSSAGYSFGSMGGVFIDVSGDDEYSSVGSSFGAAGGVFVDWVGSDSYTCGPYCYGGGLPSGGVFIDRAGNDDYSSNGFSFASTGGIFVDYAGNDHYKDARSKSFASTAGLFMDLAGDDSYDSRIYSLGYLGSFFLDAGGNDDYRLEGALNPCCGGLHKEGYGFGDRGVFVDLWGFDRYESGGFSTFGRTGLFLDGYGDDEYFQDAPSSLGYNTAGIFADLQGDDKYSGFVDESYGAGFDNWPRGSGAFINIGGDDVYPDSNGNAFGARGLFWDSHDPGEDGGVEGRLILNGEDQEPPGLESPLTRLRDSTVAMSWPGVDGVVVAQGQPYEGVLELTSRVPMQILATSQFGDSATFEPSDLMPGIDAHWAPTGSSIGFTFTPTRAGSHVLQAEARDLMPGNTWLQAPGPKINVDGAPPSIGFSLDDGTGFPGSHSLASYHSESGPGALLNISADDSMAGLHEVYVRIGTPPAVGQTAYRQFEQAPDALGYGRLGPWHDDVPLASLPSGTHSVHVLAIDAVGNQAASMVVVRIDREAPMLDVHIPDASFDGWFASPPTLHVNVTDGLSGLESLRLDYTGPDNRTVNLPLSGNHTAAQIQEILESGNWTVDLVAADAAHTSNTAEVTRNFAIDNDAPSIELRLPQNHSLAPSVVNVVGADAHSGVNATYGRAYLDGTTPPPFTVDDSLSLPTSGSWVVEAYAQDKVGHASPVINATVTLANSPPDAEFIVNRSTVLTGEPIAFTDTSIDRDGVIQQVAWDFGDGTTASGTPVTHTYSDDGDYVVTLTATDDRNQIGAMQQTIHVLNRAPLLDAIASHTVADRNTAVTFNGTAQDLDGSVDLTWSIEGQPYSGSQVSHTFQALGPHTATATATDDDGATTTATVHVDIINLEPTVGLAGPLHARVGEDVMFQVDATDADGSITSLQVNTGDGSTMSGPYTHAYDAPGFYTATATAVDNNGGIREVLHIIRVVDLILPTAAMTPPAHVQVNQPATFLDASIAGDLGIVDARWFIDGVPAGHSLLEHTFTTRGHHAVTLQVEDEAGHQDQVTQTIFVMGLPPVADFEVPAIVSTEDAMFTSTSTDPFDLQLTWRWAVNSPGDVPDEADWIDVSALSRSFLPGAHAVWLNVVNEDGLEDTISKEFVVENQLPVVDFDVVRPSHGVVELSSSSRDVDGSIVQSKWWVDGFEYQGATAVHTFGAPGTYSISLHVEDDLGAMSTDSKAIVVDARPPTITIDADSVDVLTGDDVAWSATVSAPDGGGVVSWTFGDGVSAQGVDVVHAFADDGDFTVAATVTDQFGASASDSLVVAVGNRGPAVSIQGPDEVTGSGLFEAVVRDPDGSVVSIVWQDGSSGASQVFALEPGVVLLEVVVTDDDGALATATKTVTVLPGDESGQDGQQGNPEGDQGGEHDENEQDQGTGSGGDTSGDLDATSNHSDKESPAPMGLLLVALAVALGRRR